jgi:hypothetical protein
MDKLDHHVSRLSLICGKGPTDIKDLLLDQSIDTIRSMIGDEIKKILRYFKDEAGYPNISLHKKKADIVTQLEVLLIGFRGGNGSANRVVNGIVNGAAARQPQHLQQHPTGASQQVRAPTIPHQQAVPPPQISAEMQAAQMAALNALRAVLNTKEKLAAFNELRGAGFTEKEVIECITEAEDEEMNDVDLLICKLIARREGDEAPNGSPSAEEKEQEDKDMDQAILNSEGEREIIQDRKRRRLQDIGSDCSCSLRDADEFRNSFLLGKRGLDEALKTLMIELNINPHHFKSEILSQVVQLLDMQTCKTFGSFTPSLPPSLSLSVPASATSLSSSSSSSNQSNNSSASSSASSITSNCSSSKDGDCCCPEVWRRLRSVLSRLLLLEVTAIKFSKQNCNAYFLKLARRLDTEISADIFCKIESSSSSSSSLSSLAGDASSVNKSSSALSLEEFFKVLDTECLTLEKALYDLPADGNEIPFIFREADPIARRVSEKICRYNMDDDGFEVVVTAAKVAVV